MDGLRDDSRLSVPEHVLARKAAGETVVLNLDNEHYYGLEGVGTRLWELVETGTTLGDIVTTLLDEYEVERDALLADLTVILNDLQNNGLVLVDAT
jgi:hypothetical protein